MAKMTTEERQARTELRRGAKIVWNRAALDAAELGMADALEAIGTKMVADASATMRPGHLDAPPIGKGLVASGVTAVWAKGTLVKGSTKVKASANKPRGLRVPKDQVVLIAGFASPLAHLHELGTINMIARPFLTPSFNKNITGLERLVVPAIGKRVRGVR